MNQDNIIRAYTRLVALKQNLSSAYDIKEKYVKEYHEIIDMLSKETNALFEEFRIPTQEIKYQMTSCWPADPYSGQEAGQTYSEDRYCEKELFLSKLDALLSYFQIKYLSQEKQEIGFKPPEK